MPRFSWDTVQKEPQELDSLIKFIRDASAIQGYRFDASEPDPSMKYIADQLEELRRGGMTGGQEQYERYMRTLSYQLSRIQDVRYRAKKGKDEEKNQRIEKRYQEDKKKAEAVAGLDGYRDVLEVAPLPEPDTLEYYVQNVNVSLNESIGRGDKLEPMAAHRLAACYVAAHELAPDEKDWRSVRIDEVGFEKRAEDIDAIFSNVVVPQEEIDEVEEKITPLLVRAKNGEELDRAMYRWCVAGAREGNNYSLRRDVLAHNPKDEVTAEHITRALTEQAVARLNPDSGGRFRDAVSVANQAEVFCGQTMEGFVQSLPQDKLRGLFKKDDRGAALNSAVGRYFAKMDRFPDGMEQFLAPTAKNYIEVTQKKLEATKDPEKRMLYVAQIIAARETVGTKRGGDEKLLRQLDPVRFQNKTDSVRDQLSRLPQKTIDKLCKQATSGHGGEMLETYKKENTFARQMEGVKADFRRPDGPHMDMATAWVICQIAGQMPNAPVDEAKVEKTAQTMRRDEAFRSLAADPRTAEMLGRGDIGALAEMYNKHAEAVQREKAEPERTAQAYQEPQAEQQKNPRRPRV